MASKSKCKTCGSNLHYTYQCFQTQKKRIRPESYKVEVKRTETSRQWFELNPEDSRGRWFCYLYISPQCPKVLTRSTINLEHVRSKARYPELKFDVTNLRASCSFCNKLKGSLDLEDLLGDFPHLAVYIT